MHTENLNPNVAVMKPCPYRKLNPDVLVVQSAQNWHSLYATEWFDDARRRRVLVQGQVRSGAIIVIGISSKQTPKMPLTKYHDVVKAFPSDRSDQPLTIAILPWRPRRGRPIPNTHRPKAPDEDFAYFQRDSRSKKSNQPAPNQSAELEHRAEDSLDS